jgi:chromodomain-helicase-DNA-binding protein 7
MLRFSDDELPNQDVQGKKTDGNGATKPVSDKKTSEGGDVGPNKPNFVYIVSSTRST